MAADLKPCPFCGGPNIEVHADGVIECCDCGSTAQDDLIWNSRREPIATAGVGGNRCGCSYWLTKPCPSRNCPWKGKRPIDVVLGTLPEASDDR